MIELEFRGAFDSSWQSAPVLAVGDLYRLIGDVSVPVKTPATYVTVSDDGTPRLLIEVYDVCSPCFVFQEALLWQGWIVIGYGSCVHLAALDGSRSGTYNLDSYFGHLYAGDDYLLVADAAWLTCLSPDCTLEWQSGPLGIDGVLVDRVEGGTVYGEGEWDPPGGWRPFRVSLETGEKVF